MSLSVVSSSLRRCTLQLFRTTQARGFASKFNGRQLHNADCNTTASKFEPQLKTPTVNEGVYSVNQTHSWQDDESAMKASWRDVVHQLTGTGPFLLLPEAMPWIAEALDYNVPTGNKRRYFVLLHAYKHFMPADQLTDENLRLARMLGWCVEMWIGGFFVLDDIMDNAEIRRHKICWHKKDNIGVNAIIDGLGILNYPFELLHRHFRDKPCYTEILELCQQLTLKGAIGVTAETLSTKFSKKPDLNYFTMNLYNRTALYKTSHTIVAPVHLAMYLAGIKDPEWLSKSEIILQELGRFYQVQNDYRDCFGNPDMKTETDISEGRFSWLITAALQRVTPEQRKILEECYGESDPEKVATVKQIYVDVGMHKAYAEYVEQYYNLINMYIQQLPHSLPHEIFYKYRDNIFEINS